MSKKKWIIAMAAVLIIVAAAIIVWKVTKADNDIITHVKLEGDFSGSYADIDQKGIKMQIPLGDGEHKPFTVSDDDDSPLMLDGNDYMITICRQKDKPYIKNSYVEADMLEYYDGCKTINEYRVKTLLEDKADEMDLVMLSCFGDAYALAEKERYVCIVILMPPEKGMGYESVTIEIFDTEDEYAHMADVTLWKYSPDGTNMMTLEEIAFMVESIEISPY